MSAESTLDAWRRREAAVRQTMAPPGTASVSDIGARSGIEFFEDIMSGKLGGAPIASTLDFVLVEVEPGRVTFQGTPAFAHYNPIGSVHGGWFCTLLDSAMGCAVHSTLPPGRGYTTLEVKVNMLRRLTAQTGPVRAEGRVVHVGATTGMAEDRIVDAAGKLYAAGTTTCLVLPLDRD